MEQTNIDSLFAAPDRNMLSIRKWLRALLAVHIAMLSVSVLRNVIDFGKVYTWINAALDIAAIFCLLQLRKENRLYTLAAGLMIADLVISLPDYVTFFRSILGDGYLEQVIHMVQAVSYLPLACAVGAVAVEYLAHRRLVKPYDAKLSQRWFQLMIVNLAVSVLLSGIGSILASLIENGTLSIMIYQNYMFPLLRLPGIAVSVLYMVCLHKTERKLAKI